MAEVIAAFGTLSAFLQVVDFTAKLLTHAHELIRSGVDSVRENIETERLAREYEFLGRIAAHCGDGSPQTKEEKAIAQLGQACQKESQVLLKLLDGLRISAGQHGVRRLKEGASKAVKILRHQRKIQEHRTHLQELNGQLATALLISLHAKDRAHHTTHISDRPLKGAELNLGSGIGEVAEVVAAVVGNDVQKIKALVEKEKLRHIRANLRFNEASRRWTAIARAYPKTYSWVLEKDSLGFTSWLRNKSGIFWVNGKAGSGKSTLLKFLSEHSTTRYMLSNWAGTSQLVFASFYFWYLGDPMQRTERGLCQSILYQILQTDDELARLAFPRYFNSVIRFDEPITWSDEELRSALRTLASHRNTRRVNKKFCLVIDGLDEYHGDSLDLLGLLSELVENPDVKLCVSSRPWNAFVDAFESSVPNLRLEDLSSDDHRTYAHGRVQAARRIKGPRLKASSTDIDILIDEIVKGAEGVFLWVFLVVKSVLAGIAEGESIDFLRHRVQSFPRDLNDFFRHILGQVDEVYRLQTNQALKLACMYTHENGDSKQRSSFIDYWLIKQHPRGLETESVVYDLPIQQVSSDQVEEMFLDTRSFLSACCKGLLYIPVASIDGQPQINLQTKVEFLHRTVYDYLTQGDIQESIDEHVPAHFKTSRIFHLLNLARVKCALPILGGGSARFDVINSAASFSLHIENRDLREMDVEQFEALVLSQPVHGNPWWFTSVKAFMYFQRYHYLKSCFSLGMSRNVPISSWQFPTRASLIEAILGESSDWPFGAEKISWELLELALSDRVTVEEVLYYWRTIYPGSLWQFLLRKWSVSDVDYSKHSCINATNSKPDGTYDLWKIMQLLVEVGVSPEKEFRSGTEGTKQSACEFLKSRLPANLHQEVGELFE